MSFDSMRLLFEAGKFPSPSFVYDEAAIVGNLKGLDALRLETGCKILFPLKAFSAVDGLNLISQYVDGFSVSSLFEASLAKGILGHSKSVHMTTPGLIADQFEQICSLCDYISFNSIPQLRRYYIKVSDKSNYGLRINPQLSFVKESKYNPCRPNSKLGVPIELLKDIINTDKVATNRIKGIHFHSNCESNNFEELLITVKHIADHLPEILSQIDWINLGGGYLFDSAGNYGKLCEAIFLLRKNFGIGEVFVEPGNGIIGNAGYIISSVLDVFESEGKRIAILDTTVNHMPEVFEYEYRPDIIEEAENGKYKYMLAGCSCLAGDLFGEFRFADPLEIGSQIVFENMGAYTMVKANMFNGINLPTIYAYTLDGKLEMKRKFTYEDFVSRCGANGHVPI